MMQFDRWCLGKRSNGIRSSRRLQHEHLDIRLLLTSIVFVPHEVDLTSRGSFSFQERSAVTADFDGDGDLDIASSSRRENSITWHENIDNARVFQRHLVTGEAKEANLISAADLDNDGDTDLLYASSRSNTIAWRDNLGTGQFGSERLISNVANSVMSIALSDVDGDGDLDLLAALAGDDTIGWYENLDGVGTFSPIRSTTNRADGAHSIYGVDLDGDDDIDVLAASSLDDTIAWNENQGQGVFGDRRAINEPDLASAKAAFVIAADLDGDGDKDVLTVSSDQSTLVRSEKEVAWHENVDGLGMFGPAQQIMRDNAFWFPRIDAAFAADLDNDGDLDVVTSHEFSHQVYWFENMDGRGTFGGMKQISRSSEFHGSLSMMADLDNDGDVDILTASDHEGMIAWHENRLIGDSNNDGVFNTSDFVLVFQAGEYLDDVAGNSTFDEGDWNLDGEFSPADLIFAFQAGTFTVPTA